MTGVTPTGVLFATGVALASYFQLALLTSDTPAFFAAPCNTWFSRTQLPPVGYAGQKEVITQHAETSKAHRSKEVAVYSCPVETAPAWRGMNELFEVKITYMTLEEDILRNGQPVLIMCDDHTQSYIQQQCGEFWDQYTLNGKLIISRVGPIPRAWIDRGGVLEVMHYCPLTRTVHSHNTYPTSIVRLAP